jgi:hypothetical protein
MQKMARQLLTTGDVAKRWGCSTQTVRNIWGSGFMVAVVSPGTQGEHCYLQFDLTEIERVEKVLGITAKADGSPWAVKQSKVAIPGSLTSDLVSVKIEKG